MKKRWKCEGVLLSVTHSWDLGLLKHFRCELGQLKHFRCEFPGAAGMPPDDPVHKDLGNNIAIICTAFPGSGQMKM